MAPTKLSTATVHWNRNTRSPKCHKSVPPAATVSKQTKNHCDVRTADRASTANMLQVTDTRFAKACDDLCRLKLCFQVLNSTQHCLVQRGSCRPNHSFEHYSNSNVRERRLLCYVWLSIQFMFPCFPVPRFPPLQNWSSVFQSCDFHPCDLVPRFPVLHFPVPCFQRPPVTWNNILLYGTIILQTYTRHVTTKITVTVTEML